MTIKWGYFVQILPQLVKGLGLFVGVVAFRYQHRAYNGVPQLPQT